ncbi:hypothetical protein RJ641_026114 [Dillenia turbinata]|uniref:Nudix hydrolase domain-containing protein n=1 Tax=Dillenia turbinata TaxID=194707 RepID=A0AAN8WFF1_9MAGN
MSQKTSLISLEMQTEFIPFVIEEQIVLRRFRDVFVFPQGNSSRSHFGGHVSLHPSLKFHDDRTQAAGDVIKCLELMIPGIRNGAKYKWIGIRSENPHIQGCLTILLLEDWSPHGVACGENLLKECEEEAGIPKSISSNWCCLLYMDIEDHRFKRDVLFCYDLKLPEGFVPKNQGEKLRRQFFLYLADGEVEDFKLIPVSNVANVIRRTHFFKPTARLVKSGNRLANTRSPMKNLQIQFPDCYTSEGVNRSTMVANKISGVTEHVNKTKTKPPKQWREISIHTT